MLTHIPSPEPLARNTRLVWGLGQCVCVCVLVFVCESVCNGKEVAEGLDGWQREEQQPHKAWRTSSIALSIFPFLLLLSAAFPLVQSLRLHHFLRVLSFSSCLFLSDLVSLYAITVFSMSLPSSISSQQSLSLSLCLLSCYCLISKHSGLI